MTHKEPPCPYEEILKYYDNPNNKNIERAILLNLNVLRGHFNRPYRSSSTGKNFLN